MINPKQLVAPAISVGRLIGLLKTKEGGYEVDTDWFADPVARLEASGTRLDQLVSLLYQVLGEPAAKPSPPPVFKGANWLMLPNPDPASDGKSPLYVVLPPKGSESGEIGLGSLVVNAQGKLSFTFYAYVPLFSFGKEGVKFLLSQPGAALRLGLELVAKEKIKVGDASFEGININATIYFDGATPKAELAFIRLEGTTLEAVYSKLDGLLNPTVKEWLSSALLQSTAWLNKPIGSSAATPGMLLAAGGFVQEQPSNGDSKYSLSLEKLKDLKPGKIALNFLWKGLDKLVQSGKTIVKLPGGGISAVAGTDEEADTDKDKDTVSNAAKDPSRYGLRLQMNLPLTKDKDGKKASPLVNLVVGNWLGGEDDDENWMTRTTDEVPDSGLTVWLLGRDAAGDPSFAPHFSLVSAGLDISGGADKALVDLSGYTLQGAELRATLNAPEMAPSSWTYGFATKLDRLGLPMVPTVGEGEGRSTNPVAQSLLQASGPAADEKTTPEEADDESGDQAPANPAFGAAVAWYRGGAVNVQLFDDDDTPAEEVLIPINRALGPLFCQRLGVGWVDESRRLSLLFDGSVRVGPLAVALDGLTVGIPVKTPTKVSDYELDLQGLGIAFSAGAVSLNAALVKVPADDDQHPYVEYQGTASLETSAFSLTALGSYAWLPATASQPGYASLFIFGAQLSTIGGPSFFFVTGLAAGFGYNRALRLPAQDKVPDFPLVQVLNDPKKLGATETDGKWSFPEPTAVLAKLGDVVPPERGQYWLAAGVRFTSFELVHTSALVSVAFGNELKIGVTGISWLSLPPPPKPGGTPPNTRFAYVEMGVAIEIIPAEGVITATAILTPNSYVIDPACRLTGGFAFYTWFGNNPHAGEFVLTAGGYHPAFVPPAHYPKVPRLGFRWQLSDSVSISGDAYFALTPSAIMAGGGLQVLFSSGNLNAWFIAQMDALVQWAPFQYNLAISVSIGVSYRLNLLFVTVTLKVELGASLLLWGPRMGGQAHVSWSIISFTVGFGADRPAPNRTLGWEDANGQGFAQTLLPHRTGDAPKSRRLSALALAAGGQPLRDDAPSSEPSGVLTLAPLSGVGQDEDDATVWVVRPAAFSFSALTSFPLTELLVTAAPGGTARTTWKATEECPDGAGYFVCIRPMRTTIATSVLTATLTNDTTGKVYDLAGYFTLDLSIVPQQAAKWGRPLPLGADPEMSATLPGRLMGFAAITPKVTTLSPSGEQALNIDMATAFRPDVVNEDSPDHLPLSGAARPSEAVPTASATAWNTIGDSLRRPATTAARTAVYDTLVAQFGLDPRSNGPVAAFAEAPGAWLNGQPLILSSN